MSTLPKYDSYKDSGIPWLGEIPEHWEVQRGKSLHSYLKMLNLKNQCNNILSLTLRGVVNNNSDTPEGLVPKDYNTYQIFEKNNLVFKLIDLENFRTSRVGLVYEKGIMSPAYIRVKLNNLCEPKYYYYFYYSLYLEGIYNEMGAGVRSTLTPTDLLNMLIPLPPLSEQIRIATFLDRKTGQIDDAITKKERLIELLKEEKSIIINQAVTKGLNPNAPMKDSGIKWIGKIPEHWEVKKNKYLLIERKKRSIDASEEPLSMSQKLGIIKSSQMGNIPYQAESLIGNKICYEGDLVFNKLKSHLGVFSVSKYNGLVSPDYAVYHPKPGVSAQFMEYLFKTPNYIGEFIKVATGIVEGLTRLYTSDLFEIYTAIPEIKEQDEIIAYIAKESAEIANLIEKTEQEIEKLKELKSVLISEAVTGKIKV